MRQLNYYDCDKVTFCPYCGDQKSRSETGCCGESSCHFETGYLDQDDTLHPESEVEIVRPIFDVIRYEIFNSHIRRIKLRQLQSRFKTLLCDLYDGSKWDVKTHSVKTSFLKRLRVRTGFQWSKLDCLILKQLHFFPLYYTPPKIAENQRLEAIEQQKKFNTDKS
jgi:hypothetical protein